MYVTHMMPLYPSQDAYFGRCPHSKGVALTGTPLRLPTVKLFLSKMLYINKKDVAKSVDTVLCKYYMVST